MEQFLSEPEDRLGSQASASVSRPNSMIVNARRSGFIPMHGTSGNIDGADLIKVYSSCYLSQKTAYAYINIFNHLRLIPGFEGLIG